MMDLSIVQGMAHEGALFIKKQRKIIRRQRAAIAALSILCLALGAVILL